ncbi:hypothetical protein D3C86_1492650 [compost metagenome]
MPRLVSRLSRIGSTSGAIRPLMAVINSETTSDSVDSKVLSSDPNRLPMAGVCLISVNPPSVPFRLPTTPVIVTGCVGIGETLISWGLAKV